jgi:hypothetical protein
VITDNRFYIDAYRPDGRRYQLMGKTRSVRRAGKGGAVAQFRAAPAQLGQLPQAGEYPHGGKGLPQMHRDRRILGA